MSLPPDPDSVVKVIKRAHCQAYVWYRCGQRTINHLDLEEFGWKIQDGDVKPVWFVGNQFPPSVKSIRGRKAKDGSLGDCDICNSEKMPPKKKGLKTQTISDEAEDSPMAETAIINSGEEGDKESDTNDCVARENSSDESEWEVFDLMSSEDSCDEWLPFYWSVEVASYGHEVRAYDKDQWQRETLICRAQQLWLQLERKELVDLATKFHENIIICQDLKSAVENVDFIFEAASENIRLKKSLLKDISAVCGSQTVIGTNSLTLSLNEITEDALFNERILGLRFIYPVFAIPFLEYSTSSKTSPAAIDRAKRLFESMSKVLVQRAEGDQPRLLDGSEVEFYHNEFRAKKKALSHQTAHGASVPQPAHGQHQQQHHGSASSKGTDRENSVRCTDGPTDQDSNEKADECVVCNENSINAILFPCRHMWLCYPCAQRLKALEKPCPACRATIGDVVSVFKP